jgi:hypothetical protein
LNILYIPDLAYFHDGLDLIGVRFNATLGDDVPQELALGDPKGAFFGLSFMLNHLGLLKVSFRPAMRLLLLQDLTVISSM